MSPKPSARVTAASLLGLGDVAMLERQGLVVVDANDLAALIEHMETVVLDDLVTKGEAHSTPHGVLMAALKLRSALRDAKGAG